MAIEAQTSRFRKNSIVIYMVICIVLACWFGYDGYLSESFEQKHTKPDGQPDSTLVFNRKSPPFFFAGAILLGVYYLAIKNKQILADDERIILADGRGIPYQSVQKIDKTHFDSKGFFTFTYTDQNGVEAEQKLSTRKYDNLPAVLQQLVAKIS